MQSDNLHTGEEVREKLFKGIKKISDAVGGTMGTGGYNGLIEAIESPGHILTNDGITIAQSIVLADPIEDMGRKILLESISRANKQSGDGSSTTCVLTSAILEEGMKHLKDASPMEIKKSLEECVPLIEASINSQKRDITVDDVGSVAAISSEDEKIGAMIQEIYQQIGKEGIIQWDISKTFEDYYTIGSGITIDGAGFMSPYMCDASESGQNTNKIRLKNANILILKQKLTSANELNDIGLSLNNQEIKDLIIFCDEVDPLVISSLVMTRMQRGFRFVLVKMPTLWKDWWFEDLAKATGATIVDALSGLSLKNFKMEHLGKVGNIVITKDNAFIDGILDVSEYIKFLEEEGSDDSKLRIARLNTKTARYFVGAQSDSALAYRRLKVEDALSASHQALQNGIVAGGGSVLASIELNNSVGGNILNIALKIPAKQIASNAGVNILVGYDYKNGFGFDTFSKSFVNMFDAGIVDPANVVLNAVRNAVSVAASVLTASVVVTFPKQS